MDLSFVVHKLAKISSNPGKVHFEGLLHLLRYNMDHITLGLNKYADMNDAPVFYILIQVSIKIENQFMAFSDSGCHDCSYTGRSTGAYIIFYQGGTIDHGTHVPGPVTQSSENNEYNAA